MDQVITSSGIANRARMLRDEREFKTGSIPACLLIEGDTDEPLYHNLVNQAACLVVKARGKDKVIQALRLLETDLTFTGVLAVVDADFDFLEGKSQVEANLIRTDTHDLETLLVASPAFEKLLRALLFPDRLSDVDIVAAKVRSTVVELGRPIAYLRWASLKNGTHLSFKDLTYSAFVLFNPVRLDLNRLVKQVRENSACSKTEVQLWTESAALESSSHDPWKLCCGHDLINILVLILPVMLRNENLSSESRIREHASSCPQLVRCLVLGFERSHFKRTALFSGIQNWEASHPPFKILADM
jgi:hypothetical protein